jgi:hypothetical protein
VHVYERLETQIEALPVIEAFFAGDDDIARMQPKLHSVTFGEVTHLDQRCASCCRYYLLPHGSLCVSNSDELLTLLPDLDVIDHRQRLLDKNRAVVEYVGLKPEIRRGPEKAQ